MEPYENACRVVLDAVPGRLVRPLSVAGRRGEIVHPRFISPVLGIIIVTGRGRIEPMATVGR